LIRIEEKDELQNLKHETRILCQDKKLAFSNSFSSCSFGHNLNRQILSIIVDLWAKAKVAQVLLHPSHTTLQVYYEYLTDSVSDVRPRSL
jgi:hypothetical protein